MKRNYIFALAMILLSASAGFGGWDVKVKTIDADTGQPIPQRFYRVRHN